MSDTSSSFTLWSQGLQVALPVGFELQRALFPMLVPANPGGPVAVVNANPNDPTQIGLRNLTQAPWVAILPDGTQKEIPPDKSIRLAAGTVIQAGPLRWEIREQVAPASPPPPVFASPPPVVGQPMPFGTPPPANPGFLAASEPAPNPGFLAASEPMPQQAGFAPGGPAAPPGAYPPGGMPPPAAQPGYVLGQPAPYGQPPGQPPFGHPPGPMGFVPDGQAGMPPPRRPGGAARNILASSSLSFSQLVPVSGDRQVLMSKGFLIPGALTAVLVAVLLFAMSLNDKNPRASFGIYSTALGAYLGLAGLYFVYRLCGKEKPWWVLAGVAAFTWLGLATQIIFTPVALVFRHLLPGNPVDGEPLVPSFIHYLFGAGFCEEFYKSIPVFICLFLGRRLLPPKREQIGVWEPLDGILLGAASALGFTMAETLGQYVPNLVGQAINGSTDPNVIIAAQGLGLELMIPRIIGEISGHLAYAGYFGYFIGLSALKPKHRWKILGVGYVSAALCHALWDTTCGLPGGVLFMVILGIVCFAFLVAAILKARQLSPNRAQNFATQIKGVS